MGEHRCHVYVWIQYLGLKYRSAFEIEMVITMSIKSKPKIYIASPYSKGDPAINAHFQCKIFDTLMDDGRCTPIAPLWSHFQHAMFPRRYEDWLQYDLELLDGCAGCIRLNAEIPELGYVQADSQGADREVAKFKDTGRPVFLSLNELYAWLDVG